MKLETFDMERLQSTWENHVAWNVSESGVHPLRVGELADRPEERAALLEQPLVYPQTNGTLELRSEIAAMYAGATPEHVEVTNGGSEANCISLMHLIQPGDDAVMMVPNYMQVRGLARGLGAAVRPWPLVQDQEEGAARWRPDLDALASLITSRTRLILICNPNNPTGARLTADELDGICGIASRAGAWVLSDEIYRGAELDGEETPTIWGRYDRAIVTSGLSKAYGLPGLRIGWVVGPPDLVAALWGVHDYTTIAPGALNDRLARIALAPSGRERLLARTRSIIRTNYPLVRQWIDHRDPLLSHVPPEAGAIVFVRYHHPIGSTALVTRLREERGVLVVPGDHFDMDGYLRIGFGGEVAHLRGSLDRMGDLLDTLQPAPADAR
ncbi:MAG TPA: aminotransferase class I/II-fold pyridoxal phosphate-dependent enzyme [Vicinamibacterales bacterium]|nr:aminotransferase class I/II-fold pyridoxal phosphate-dependent enzyme [Vicinamibacterales bacterium]